jgi:hypothetical protein
MKTRILFGALIVGLLVAAVVPAEAAGPVVGNPRVTCDRWPSHYDAKCWMTDVWRIEGARTGEQKAIALYKWVRRQLHWGGPVQDGTRGTRRVTMDAIKKINVSPYGYCVDFGITAAALGHAGGLKSVESHVPGHTQLEVFYNDKDGVERWHRFDPFWGVAVYDKTGSHIATWQEIKADPNVALKPSKTLLPWGDKKDDRTRYAKKGAAKPDNRVRPARYTMDKPLYAGETYTLRWDRNKKLAFLNSDPKRRDKMEFFGMQRFQYARGKLDKLKFGHEDLRPHLETDGKRITVPIAHGTLDFRPRLDAKFGDSVYSAPVNVVADAKGLRPAKAGTTAQLVYLVQTPYIFADAAFSGAFRGGLDDLVMVSIAYADWRTNKWTLDQVVPKTPKWKTVWEFKGAGSRKMTLGEDVLKLRGEYKVLVKIEMTAKKDAASAGVKSLALGVTFQEAVMALPRLMPGKNVISVAGGRMQPGYGLRVAYCWDDANGKKRVAEKTFDALPAKFSIDAAGKRAADVRSRSMTIGPVAK